MNPSEERQHRLRQVRDEIVRALGQGMTLSAADWLSRYPELEPDLGAMLREMIARGKTRVEAGPTVDTPRASETIAISPSPSPEAPPAETIGSRTHSGPAGVTRPGPSNQSETTTGGAHADGPATGRHFHYFGDYETISILGQGGMGVVYKARQLTLNRLFALKMIRNAEFASEDQVRRFQNEAEAVATLDHPGIVPIYEVGTYEDQRYFSMKLVDGQGLDKKLWPWPRRTSASATARWPTTSIARPSSNAR
jgi:hypothetical protein